MNNNLFANSTLKKTLLFLALLLPSLGIFYQHVENDGLLGHIYFGKEMLQRANHSIKELKVPASYEHGYDGQYYAQLALDPLLLNNVTRESFDTIVRANRIFLPLTLWVICLGNEKYILYLYSIINYLFLCGYIYFIWSLLKPNRFFDWCLLFIITWQTGVLVSIDRALLDLPALFFLVLSGYLGVHEVKPKLRILSNCVFSLALLTREASLTSAGMLIREQDIKSYRNLFILGLRVFLCILPMLIWLLYVKTRLTQNGLTEAITFSFFSSYFQAWDLKISSFVMENFELAAFYLSDWERAFWELVALGSISFQGIWLIKSVKWKSPWWWMGIGNMVYIPIMGMDGFSEQAGFCRILLPMSTGFFLILKDEANRISWLFLLLGGIGLMGMVRSIFCQVI